MKSPQLENGYTKIANELYDAFAKIRIPGEARQVLDFIIRKTYGYHKKEDFISLSQFVLGTGLKRPNVVRSIKKLVEMRLIIKSDTTLVNIYRFNKDYFSWVGSIVSDTGGIKSVVRGVSEAIHTKDNIQKILLTESQKLSVCGKKPMTIRAYNENEFSDANEARIDSDGNPIKRVKKIKGENKRRGEAEELLREYYKGYEEFVGEKKDITHFSKAAYLKMAYVALPHYPLEELKEMMVKYLKTDNQIYRNNNWSISCFLSLKVLGQLKNGK